MMTLRILSVVMAVFLSACQSPPAPDLHMGKAAEVNVMSLAQPLAKQTKVLSIDWGPLGSPGQLVIAQVLTYSGKEPVITTPAGWTLIRDDSSGPTTRQTLYWHVVQASEPSAQTWTFSQRVDAQGAILLLDPAAHTSSLDISSGQSGSGNQPIAPSLTTTNDGDLILAFYASDFGPGGLSVTMPAKMSTVVDKTLAQKEYWILGGSQTSKGKIENITCDTVQLSNWVAALLAIKRGS